MFINHTHKFIFIHIPKNGGTSIRNSFDINGYDKRVARKKYPHDGTMEIRDYCGEEVWNTFYKFAVVRNPYDRLVSYYHFHKSPQYKYPATAQKMSFKEWLNRGLDSNLKKTQSDYLNEDILSPVSPNDGGLLYNIISDGSNYTTENVIYSHQNNTPGIKTIKSVLFSHTIEGTVQIVRWKFITSRVFLDIPLV